MTRRQSESPCGKLPSAASPFLYNSSGKHRRYRESTSALWEGCDGFRKPPPPGPGGRRRQGDHIGRSTVGEMDRISDRDQDRVNGGRRVARGILENGRRMEKAATMSLLCLHITVAWDVTKLRHILFQCQPALERFKLQSLMLTGFLHNQKLFLKIEKQFLIMSAV